MSVATPTTRAISDQIIDDLSGSLAQSIPIFPKAFIRVLAWSLAGVCVLLFKYANWMALQLFVAHAATTETVINGKKVIPLVEWGSLLGVGQPIGAERAQFSIAVTVTNQVGDLPAGQQLLYPATRIVYETVAAVILDAPTVNVTVRAIGDNVGGDGSGAAGNLPEDAVLSFANTPTNVATDAVVVAEVVAGADAEDMEVYRGRIIRRVQRRPQGGAYADYQSWGEEVPGIAHVYPYAGERDGGSGPGQVDIYVQATPESSGDPDGIPTEAQLDAVFANINLNDISGKAARRPVNAAINVLPISLQEFGIEVQGLFPDTAAARADIEASVQEQMALAEPFIEGLSVLPRADRITLASISGIIDQVANAHGASVSSVLLLFESAPITAYTLEHGQKAKSLTPTFVS
jgi:uncharacterized phage protein gp47/JayE